MKTLLIIGAGQHGILVKELAQDVFPDIRIEFVDDGNHIIKWKTSDLKELRKDYDAAIVSIGNNQVRKRMIDLLKELGYQIPTLVHPTAYVSPSAVINRGTIIGPNASVMSHAVVGDACIISAGAVIDHDARIGNYVHVNVGSTVVARSIVNDEDKVLAGSIYGKDYEQSLQ